MSRKKATKHAQSFIAEKSDGIVDLLDPSAAQLVTTSRPTSGAKADPKKPKSFGDFEIAPDGRIIIKVGHSLDPEFYEISRKYVIYDMDEV